MTGLVHNETILEVNYSFALGNHIILQPAAQYVINPLGAEKDAFVLGTQLGIDF